MSASAADYFLEHGSPAKGVEMLLDAKQPSKALDVCQQQNVSITEVCSAAGVCHDGTAHKDAALRAASCIQVISLPSSQLHVTGTSLCTMQYIQAAAVGPDLFGLSSGGLICIHMLW